MQHAGQTAVRAKRSLVSTFLVAVLGLFCVVCVLQSDGITADWGPLQVGYALAARPFSAVAPRSSTVEMVDKSKKIANKNVWTTFLKSSEVPPGEIVSGFRFGQEIAIANSGGTLYALSNKLPPTGQPATFGTLETGGVIREPVTGTRFNLKTGKVAKEADWIIGKAIGGFVGAISGGGLPDVPVYPVRKTLGGNIEVLINVNAKAQFEQKYWRGVLDSQGKVDGGYY
jgi:nitrite reductase/ring-hydroxylating ferredoxin subunit